MLTLNSLQRLPPPYFTFRNYFIKQGLLHYSESQYDMSKKYTSPKYVQQRTPTHTSSADFSTTNSSALFYKADYVTQKTCPLNRALRSY